MIYSDQENTRWWEGLSEYERLQLLATMIDKMDHSEFALSLANQWERSKKLSPRQIAAVRKWDK